MDGGLLTEPAASLGTDKFWTCVHEFLNGVRIASLNCVEKRLDGYAIIVLFKPRPTGKAIRPSEDSLGIDQREGRLRQRLIEPLEFFRRVSVSGLERLEQLFRLFP